ncbi:hypothetical protein SBA6_230014 [Candidatus Sulfopaludibacter sp. SbA6]|nr:hypothetical protein SBA6_230014 [Candidatus Sulfopaludibacter sp. SbA6]
MHLAFLLYVSLVNDVRTLVAKHDFAAAERTVRTYQSQSGATPEFAAALSWVARGALADKKLDRADSYAAETRKLAMELLRTRKLDADPWLPTALGASIEVHAEVMAARGERSEAVAFLREQLAAWGTTSIGERIRKNLNLLSLEGPPEPGRQAGAAARNQRVAGGRAHHSRGFARPSRSTVFLGALVPGLQNHGPDACVLDENLRSEGLDARGAH